MLPTIPWVQLIAVAAVAILAKEYLSLRSLLQEARLTGICEHCPEPVECSSKTEGGTQSKGGKQQRVFQRQEKSVNKKSVIEQISERGSSVWCTGKDHTDRLCRFRDLCYLPSSGLYVFFHGQSSILHGIPSDRFSPALLDLSTVHDHNRHLFSFVDLPAQSASNVLSSQPITYINHTAIIFQRFNVDNLMHALHDDLLPLYYTLRMYFPQNTENEPFDVQLIMMDTTEKTPHNELYQMLSVYKPLTLKEIGTSNICFHDVYLGLSKVTTWYQYGFTQPQGPITGTTVTSREIRSYTTYVKSHYGINDTKDNSDTIVLLTRRYNRLIINEVDLTISLAQELSVKVIIMSLETHTLKQIISAISTSSILIAMHGSILALSMFLPPGSILLELFPYAVPPSQYTPYATLASLPGMAIIHHAWRNFHEKNTIPHPSRPWDIGGLNHLPMQQQQSIKQSSEVQPHLCCRDPAWLYRIYQDTVIDIPEVIDVLKSAQIEKKEKMKELTDEQHDVICENISPSWVQNISCADPQTSGSGVITIEWQAPWNIRYLDSDDVQYEVWLQEVGHEEYSAWIMTKNKHTFDTGLKSNTQYNVWIRCLLDNDIIGPFNTEQVVCNA